MNRAMQKLTVTLSLCGLLLLSGCFTGPKQLHATVDDWDRQLYVDTPWFNGALWIIPVVPAARIGSLFIDGVVGNFYTFWFEDAFDGEGGTTVRHAEIASRESMKSLLRGDGLWVQTSPDS